MRCMHTGVMLDINKTNDVTSIQGKKKIRSIDTFQNSTWLESRTSNNWVNVVCLLFGVYRPTRELFTHMETSPLPFKGWEFLPMLGTHGH